MIEIVYSKDVNKKDEYLRLPRNIKQTGIVEEHKKVYIEDYVDTFINQFLDDAGESRGIIILTGKAVYNSGCNYTFVEGCVWVKGIEIVGREIFFNERIWMDIHRQVKEFYPMIDIVGWAIVSKDELIGVNDAIAKIHKDNFPGKEKILIIREILEKEQIIYNMENGIMREHRGYYTYYEKNPQMQAYMINVKENLIKTEKWEDKATKSFRNIIKEKEDVKQRKMRRNAKMMKIASLILLLLIGSSTYYNFDKLEMVQEELEKISRNINHQQVKEWFADTAGGIEKEIESGIEDIDGNSKETDKSVNSDSVLGDNVGKKEESNANTNVEGDKDITLEVNNIKGNVGKIEKNEEAGGQVENKETEINENTGGMVTEVASSESEITENVSENSESGEDEPTQEVQAPKTYIIQRGDSLEKISVKLYGNKDKVNEICQLNNISDIDKIFIGQEIIIP